MTRFSSLLKRLVKAKSPEEVLSELREKDLLAKEQFFARRAFEVEEYEDEGRHLFIELSDTSTLYLTGQYLYGYGANEDSAELAEEQAFPCTEFSILRHRTDGYVVDIQAAGRKLVCETVFPAYLPQEHKAGKVPEDGDLITAVGYEQLKKLQGRLLIDDNPDHA